ncbi:hypothetical protein F5Y18DRAFT_428011 [Xylariaceae sp. FL1019]|nr:hypothetical protein F5Y18DRAFT_428011 [Xylariaceae sp. FL1019]
MVGARGRAARAQRRAGQPSTAQPPTTQPQTAQPQTAQPPTTVQGAIEACLGNELFQYVGGDSQRAIGILCEWAKLWAMTRYRNMWVFHRNMNPSDRVLKSMHLGGFANINVHNPTIEQDYITALWGTFKLDTGRSNVQLEDKAASINSAFRGMYSLGHQEFWEIFAYTKTQNIEEAWVKLFSWGINVMEAYLHFLKADARELYERHIPIRHTEGQAYIQPLYNFYQNFVQHLLGAARDSSLPGFGPGPGPGPGPPGPGPGPGGPGGGGAGGGAGGAGGGRPGGDGGDSDSGPPGEPGPGPSDQGPSAPGPSTDPRTSWWDDALAVSPDLGKAKLILTGSRKMQIRKLNGVVSFCRSCLDVFSANSGCTNCDVSAWLRHTNNDGDDDAGATQAVGLGIDNALYPESYTESEVKEAMQQAPDIDKDGTLLSARRKRFQLHLLKSTILTLQEEYKTAVQGMGEDYGLPNDFSLTMDIFPAEEDTLKTPKRKGPTFIQTPFGSPLSDSTTLVDDSDMHPLKRFRSTSSTMTKVGRESGMNDIFNPKKRPDPFSSEPETKVGGVRNDVATSSAPQNIPPSSS